MTHSIKELLRRIEALEQQVRELQARPAHVHYHYPTPAIPQIPVYNPPNWQPQPYWPSPVWCSTSSNKLTDGFNAVRGQEQPR